jgi:hypothetical protein
MMNRGMNLQCSVASQAQTTWRIRHQFQSRNETVGKLGKTMPARILSDGHTQGQRQKFIPDKNCRLLTGFNWKRATRATETSSPIVSHSPYLRLCSQFSYDRNFNVLQNFLCLQFPDYIQYTFLFNDAFSWPSSKSRSLFGNMCWCAGHTRWQACQKILASHNCKLW